MRPKEVGLSIFLDGCLKKFSDSNCPLPGVEASANRKAFSEQIIESIRRVRFVAVIRSRDISSLRADPASELFDPIRAAVLHINNGDIEEAFWLVFLFVHFGKSIRTGWRLTRDVYGALGEKKLWNWHRTSANPQDFQKWLAAKQLTLQGRDGVRRQFGNHRKYESLDASSDAWTGNVIESYVKWIGTHGSHLDLVNNARMKVGGNPQQVFSYLYRSMDAVKRFGRTARFDYLTMIAKLGLAPIEPGTAFLQGATGPLKGARLLFGGSRTSALSVQDLEAWLAELGSELKIGMMAMQVLEDALCNWQKSPDTFKAFRG